MSKKLDETVVMTVKRVFMHAKPHGDEIFAYLLVILFGSKRFVGIADAPITFLIRGLYKTWDELVELGHVAFGSAPKTKFDEHVNENGVERLPGECCATLVAKFLGVDDDPELAPLLQEVLKFDSQGVEHAGMSLAELAKVMHRVFPNNPNHVITHVKEGYDAIVVYQGYPQGVVAGEKTLLDIFQEQRTAEPDKWANSYVCRRMEEEIKKGARSGHMTDASNVLRCFYRSQLFRKREEDAPEKWAIETLRAVYADQRQFVNERQRIFARVKPITVEVFRGHGRTEPVKMYAFRSDSTRAEKAARSLGGAVVAILRSTGYVQIHTNRKFRMELDHIAEMMRYLELSPEQRVGVYLDDLAGDGSHPLVPNWYLFKGDETKGEAGQMLANGTLTHEPTPTRIPFKAIVEALMHGFHPSYRTHWCNQRDLRMHRVIASKAPSATPPPEKVNGKRNGAHGSAGPKPVAKPAEGAEASAQPELEQPAATSTGLKPGEGLGSFEAAFKQAEDQRIAKKAEERQKLEAAARKAGINGNGKATGDAQPVAKAS